MKRGGERGPRGPHSRSKQRGHGALLRGVLQGSERRSSHAVGSDEPLGIAQRLGQMQGSGMCLRRGASHWLKASARPCVCLLVLRDSVLAYNNGYNGYDGFGWELRVVPIRTSVAHQ